MAIIYLTRFPKCPAPRCRVRLLPEGFFPRLRGKNERAAPPSALSCTTWGFSCDSAYAKLRWALTPPFHPYPARLVVSASASVSQTSIEVSATETLVRLQA